MSKFYITVECPNCDAEIKQLCEDMSNEIPHVSYDFASCLSFTCDECDQTCGTGDFDLFAEDEM